MIERGIKNFPINWLDELNADAYDESIYMIFQKYTSDNNSIYGEKYNDNLNYLLNYFESYDEYEKCAELIRMRQIFVGLDPISDEYIKNLINKK